MKKHVIFKTYGTMSLQEIEETEKHAEEVLKEIGIEDPTQEDIMQEVYDNEEMWYEDEKYNLNKVLDNNIIAIASVGTWRGRRTGYKILGDNLNEILYFMKCDDIEVYYDGHNVKATGHHHDGSHYVEYRMIRNMDNIDRFTDKLYNGEKVTRSMINYYTKPLTEVTEIFGW